MTRVDIAIIGSGPAGLEAALTAKNRNKSIQIFGTKDLSITGIAEDGREIQIFKDGNWAL